MRNILTTINKPIATPIATPFSLTALAVSSTTLFAVFVACLVTYFCI